MRAKKTLSLAIVAGFAASLIGCNSGSDVQLEKVPAVETKPTQPLPKDIRSGGGKGSSGNIGRDPGANT